MDFKIATLRPIAVGKGKGFVINRIGAGCCCCLGRGDIFDGGVILGGFKFLFLGKEGIRKGRAQSTG